MNSGEGLRWARRRVGLSQRALSERAGVPQSTIARIEAGLVDPRASTLSRLLQVCGYDLEVQPALGAGVDRTLIRELLALPPGARVARLAAESRFLAALDEGGRRSRLSPA